MKKWQKKTREGEKDSGVKLFWGKVSIFDWTIE